MEVVVPLFALSSLYLINNQNKKKDEPENFSNQQALPNTNVADPNYPVDSNENETNINENDTSTDIHKRITKVKEANKLLYSHQLKNDKPVDISTQ